jgi:hypothetical protein
MQSPMPWHSPGCNTAEVAVTAELTPTQTRAQDVTFVTQCSLEGLCDRLPLHWPAPPDVSPCPKRAYRSHYTYQGWDDLRDPAAWEHLSHFGLLLRLVDFSPLRPVLAQRLGWVSARGWCPFDPVSIFLLLGWQLDQHWKRSTLLDHLHDPRFADYATRFGFENGVFPTEGGLRYWLTALGQHTSGGTTICVDEEQGLEIAIQYLNQLIAQSVTLIRDANLLSPQAWQNALICPDGMLHDAASRLRCSSVTASCYQPAPRPCPAKDKGQRGCDCDTLACAAICRRATPRDPDARFIYYEGHNQNLDATSSASDSAQAQPPPGEPRYGYASLPLLLADPDRRFSLILLDHFSPANARQENPFAAQLLLLPSFYPDLHVADVVGDAAFGYDVVLHVTYTHLHARRVIALRAHETDRNKALWSIRGYDDKGRPICPYGFSLKSNGFDFDRQRHKWACLHACLKDLAPPVSISHVAYPPAECPYLDLPHGRVLNVAERFPDHSIRLVRDVPVDSPAWKALYHRARNASEGRNATFQRYDLKRMPVYGLPRSCALTFLADVWANLTTLARLVREATAATGFIT